MAEEVAGAECGTGAFKLMRTLLMLLAVADIGCVPSLPILRSSELGDGTSSTGNPLAATARAAELVLPKLSFHFDGFFATGAGGADIGAGRRRGKGGTGGTGGAGGRRERRGVGRPYIDTGSKG